MRVELLGKGGMGEVWKGWDTELGRWVALKFPRLENPAELSRLRSEAQSAGRLSHPNVAAVYEFGQAQGRHFIAMEFVDGLSLASHPRADRKQLVALVRDAALGVAYAHAQGVIHRDLKPENIMIHRERNHIYVMDFGIARQVTSTHVSTSVIGTPPYMSPEQSRGERAGPPSDVWSLGVTLYELMADRLPFQGGSAVDVLHKIVHEEPRPLKHLDSDLRTIITKCLEKDPAQRYRNAKELSEDLTRWLGGEAIAAYPPSPFYRLRKKLAKRKVAVTVAAIELLAVIVIGAIVWPRGQGSPVGLPSRGSAEGKDSKLTTAPPGLAHNQGRPITPTSGTIDLLKSIDLDRDSIVGQWRFDKGVLVSPVLPFARVMVPVRPPEEYDLLVTATYSGPPESLNIGLVGAGRRFLVILGGLGGEVSGIHLLDGQKYDSNEATYRGKLFEEGKPSQIVCEVRRDSLTVLVDKVRVIAWKADYKRVSLDSVWAIPDERALSIGAYEGSYRITNMQLVPITGVGVRTR